MISQFAVIAPEAKIGKNVTVDPFTMIHGDVEIGEGTWIASNVTIYNGARIGKNCQIFPGAVISAVPQDLKYKGEQTTAEIGDNTTIREFVTMNKGTTDKMKTVIGSNCLVMAYAHIAHDCILGDNIILANNATLAGHVEIEDWAILEGLVAVQQFVKIGAHSFIAGGSLVRKNVPPFCKAAREPLSYVGINNVGLRRRGFSSEDVNLIQDIYRILFVQNTNLKKAMDEIEKEIAPHALKEQIVNFINNSPKGLMKGFSPSETEEEYK
jgi:UDP-N-acetylglucosamine acyltransferase